MIESERKQIIDLIRKEVIPAIGCTEPIAVALCVAKAAETLNMKPEKIEWLSVRVLLYFMLKEDKQIGYSSEGKPFLTDDSFFISISHTKGYVAVILNPKTPVGIDIEQYGKRVHKVFDRFIRPDEQVEAYQGDTTWGGLLHWSAKETVRRQSAVPSADQ